MAEIMDGLLRLLLVDVDEGVDIVEGVEEEMGIELVFEVRELGFGLHLAGRSFFVFLFSFIFFFHKNVLTLHSQLTLEELTSKDLYSQSSSHKLKLGL